MKNKREELQTRAQQEDATPDELLSPEQLARKRNRERKRKHRAEQKDAKATAEQGAAQKAMEAQMTIQEWWNFNRSKLTEEQNAELAKRQETVLDTVYWMQGWIQGTYNVDPSETDYYVGLVEGTADLDVDIRKYGTTYAFETLYQHTEQYRESASFRDNVRGYGPRVFHGKNATEIWLTTGLLVAVPSQKVCDFHVKLKPKVEVPTYAVMECTVCKSIASRTNVPQHIADDYRRLQIPYRCGICRGQQTTQMNRATEYNEVVKKPSIFDQFGRMKGI